MPEGGETRVRLHRRLYPARAVKETVAAFAEIASVHLERDGEYHIVALAPRTSELTAERLALEFANYALSRSARSR